MGCSEGVGFYENERPNERSYERSYSIGCFSGNGKVKLINNTYKKVKDLNKGDILENGSIVQCLIIMKINSILQVVEINGIYYSLKHPIMYNGNWTYPISIKKPKKVFIDYFYNLVLSKGYSVKINDIETITLGHCQVDGVAYHPYYGTEKVIQALKKYNQFNDGKILIEKKLKVERDENGRTISYF
jgi:hypothetical protein